MAVASVLGFAATTQASGSKAKRHVVIYPTGHYPKDVVNVQSAIDQLGQRGRRGQIVLDALNEDGEPTVFNFGTSADPSERGTVTIGPDGSGALKIIGVRRSGAVTTIVGGLTSIAMDRNDSIEITDLRFEGPMECGICIFRAAQVTIRRNAVIDTVGVRFLPTISASAIRIAPRSIFDITPTILGRVVVQDNLVDRVHAVYPNGISIFNTDGRILVRGNEVLGVAAGIRVEGEVRMPVRIIGNHVRVVQNPELEAEFGPGVFRIGIAGQGTQESRPSSFLIRDNLVEMDVSDFMSGISMFPINGVGFPTYAFTSSRIVDNTVILGGEVPPQAQFRLGIDFFSGSARVADTVLARNQISGVATRAFSFDGFEDPALGPRVHEHNRIVNNDLSQLTVTEASIFFDAFARENTYRGAVGDVVVDQGVDNTIVLRN